MRTHLLLLFLFVATAGMTQTMVDTYDTTFTSEFIQPSIHLLNTSHSIYDSACRLSSITYQYYDGYSQLPSHRERSLYEYDTNGNLYSSVLQKTTTTDTFINVAQFIYRYFLSNNKTSLKASNEWNGRQWVPHLLDSFNYDGAGNRTLLLHQFWDQELAAYKNDYQLINTYNSFNKQLLSRDEYWDSNMQSWNTQSETINVYDSNGFLVSDTSKGLDYNTLILGINSYEKYYNNSQGLADSLVRINVPGYDYEKTYLLYYPNFIHLQSSTTHRYNADSTLISGYRSTYYYDSSNTIQYDSSVSESMIGSSSNTYRLEGTYFNKYISNADGTLRSFETKSSAYSNGNVVYFTYYKYTYGYTPCQSVLPVTLLSFTADKKGNNAVLQWKTSNEINTASFDVQRSLDGIHFSTIATVKAAGNSSGERSYSYTDFNISQLGVSKLYYRLAQQDVDGAIHNSRIAQIDIVDGKLSITLSPNPVRNSIGIYSPVAIQNAIIRIANMNGTAVYTSRSNLSAGGKLMINATSFASGIYYVTVQTNNSIQVMKLVKE